MPQDDDELMEEWCKHVWQWWDHSDPAPEPEPVQLELPFPEQDKLEGK